uniref:BZIP domain-containing protein n=1 Tax=Oryza brachyantha TaxID=4533 RepID=J3MP98_ORYBR
MGVHTMSGGGSGGGGALSRQGSVYSLTLNEVESHLGEPLRSMNLDDLLRTVAGRKRGASAGADRVVEKTVERRQKRMIKNRESAARSRARKQAYTNELENKISRLEEENQRLREQKAVADFSTFPSCVDFLKAFLTQKLEPVMQIVPQPEPKQQLRRTNSASF